MNAKEIKNQVISDLTEIQKLCIEEIGGFAEFKGNIEDFLCKNQDELPENWTVKHEQLEINFTSVLVPSLLASVKKEFPSGIAPKSSGVGCGAQMRQKQFQRKIQELRQKYQQKTDFHEGISIFIGGRWLTSEEEKTKITAEKKAVEKMAEKDDLIRQCWAYISDPRELEGVHYSWVNPVVKFEPYFETVKN